MRILPLLLTIALVWALNHRFANKPAFGMLFSPQHGFWVHAEPSGPASSDSHISLPALKDSASVWFDERMVAHVFARNDYDAYYIQGYLHATNRLWQMELQTHAAAGRLCEILGEGLLQYDRQKRREGLTYGAEQAVKAMDADPVSKLITDAYTDGVNAYIQTLRERDYPLEYKLLGYAPEPWTKLKSALLIKYMAFDLASTGDDIAYSNARKRYGKDIFNQLYPDWPDVIAPIVPVGTPFAAATKKAVAPPDSIVTAGIGAFDPGSRPDPDNGSNNWAVAASKTKNGAPILANDPHLTLSLPSIFYEMQIHTPEVNVYGVSIPGATGVIIGFNDHIGWGLTNGYMDVLDYYTMDFRNGKSEYRFNGAWKKADMRVEEIRIKGREPFRDTVAYTVWGPVIYDPGFGGDGFGDGYLAMRWTAHDPSNELLSLYRLNRAKNYVDYTNALSIWSCPAQNFIFASKEDGIAIWNNGKHPLRWKDQGKFVMPGADSTFAWQGYIPMSENPHVQNPAQGFVQSANQHPTDSTFPYRMFGYYSIYRGLQIQERLTAMQNITPEDLMRLQNDNTNRLAVSAMPFLADFVAPAALTAAQRPYWEMLFKWDGVASPDSKAATLFNLWWENLNSRLWRDEMPVKDSLAWHIPNAEATLYWLMRDSAMRFVDNIRTPVHETLTELVTGALQEAADTAAAITSRGNLAIGNDRGTDIRHLSRSIAAFGRLGLHTGGGAHIVNATKKTHGPSWRMVVELGKETKGWGIYPGGQSGNPGSKFYDNMVDDWVAGKYYSLHVYDEHKSVDANVRKIFFVPGK
ncbi:penicillin acylase family protein [Chitinophaga caseinilytica]|uniref:penicillin acylase family protein n=1 Tax=Chitinophaga caseinilytica TaxID=2267521 RepID=UPI003C2F84F6